MTDEQLAGQSLAGSLTSFEELVRRHEARVFHYVLQRCRNPEDAQDVTQTAFVTAFRKLHQFSPRGSFRSWLFTIARNKTIDALRSRRIHEEADLECMVQTTSPADALQENEEVALLWAFAREDLNGEQFDALWLRYQEDLSVREIARTMRRTETMVKVCLFRARQKLAARLRAQAKDAPVIEEKERIATDSRAHSMARISSRPVITL